MSCSFRMSSLRPLVRYVDEQQAVIDACFEARPGLDAQAQPPAFGEVELLVSVDGDDGFHDEGGTRMRLDAGKGSVRFEVVHPERWWPASMGDQPLYTLKVGLVVGGELVDERAVQVGFTSVRRDPRPGDHAVEVLLVNGQECRVKDVLTIDRVDERALLPVTGDSLLVVRDHYGTDVLYQAADRAGIMLLQCVPVDANADQPATVADQVDRLASHPSLVGYYVGHLGRISDRVADRLKTLDPSRPVYRELPVRPAA